MNFINLIIPAAQAHTGNDYVGYHMPEMMGTWGISGFIFMILFWAIVIIGIVTAVKWLLNQDKDKTALEILQKRYAKGEINQKEYVEKKKNLTQ
jgi:putative membrane protein